MSKLNNDIRNFYPTWMKTGFGSLALMAETTIVGGNGHYICVYTCNRITQGVAVDYIVDNLIVNCK